MLNHRNGNGQTLLFPGTKTDQKRIKEDLSIRIVLYLPPVRTRTNGHQLIHVPFTPFLLFLICCITLRFSYLTLLIKVYMN